MGTKYGQIKPDRLPVFRCSFLCRLCAKIDFGTNQNVNNKNYLKAVIKVLNLLGADAVLSGDGSL